MKLLVVEAVAFGPFADERLELSPRMNVVYGPNEAGKSSWHAAMYAGICGRRRNARRKEETEFADRHRPWDDGAWAVNVLVELEDGRKIELRQDLDDPTASRALDPDLNRDITGQLASEGAPDASTLLGLSRETMFATSTVRQAEIVRVQAEADSLQNQLQAATSKAGADRTAEAAIRRIEEYKSEHVGLRRSNSTRPLQAAIDGVRAAERRLEKARQAHR
ncbi:MAG: AAA family ATPase, partial [Thermoanaerobaculia bacterium]|nr:AAA family ATPase [Thermoanaerobaculia bacterium]